MIEKISDRKTGYTEVGIIITTLLALLDKVKSEFALIVCTVLIIAYLIANIVQKVLLDSKLVTLSGGSAWESDASTDNSTTLR